MPALIIGQQVRVTLSKQLPKLQQVSCRPFTTDRPKGALQPRRLHRQSPVATAAKPDGASFPSTAGKGMQRTLNAVKIWPLQPAIGLTTKSEELVCCFSSQSLRARQAGFGGQGRRLHF